MSWLFEMQRFSSEKNGEIVCRRFFGSWWVFVDGADQSSPYIRKMWKYALKKSGANPASVLVLGLGAGSILHELPSSSKVTVIEYDPVMIEVAQKLKLLKITPRIIMDDAAQAVPALQESFDLIIVDLYKGENTAAVLESPQFLTALETRLSNHGELILNVFTNTKLLDVFGQYFQECIRWKSGFNHLALYKKQRGQGDRP